MEEGGGGQTKQAGEDAAGGAEWTATGGVMERFGSAAGGLGRLLSRRRQLPPSPGASAPRLPRIAPTISVAARPLFGAAQVAGYVDFADFLQRESTARYFLMDMNRSSSSSHLSA